MKNAPRGCSTFHRCPVRSPSRPRIHRPREGDHRRLADRRPVADAELELIDLGLLDIKIWTPDRHRVLTGMDIEPVLGFARRLATRKRPISLRYVVVPGWSDDPDEIGEVARFAASLGVVQRVDVLPFHQMGEYRLRDTRERPVNTVERACAVFRAAGLFGY